jgi:hypothetical protein
MEPVLSDLIDRIHHSGRKLVLEYAGAGSQALFWLHSVAGSSRTILEATDRYSAASLAGLLGAPPASAVAPETAHAMAEAAYRRAMRLSDGAAGCLGLACTAAITTDRERRGANRCWIAARERGGVTTAGLELRKGERTREGEEEVVSRLLLGVLAAACGLEAPALPLLPGEQVTTGHTPARDPIADLLDGNLSLVVVRADGRAGVEPVAGAILSGSFNPLHAGHEYLALAAERTLSAPVTFELAVVNADKPPLGYAEVDWRLAQFRGRFPVALSRAPLFVEKAALYPGCVFVVGYDTAARLVDPRYYGGAAGRDAALAQIAAQGCRFLIAGRLAGGVFRTLRDIAVPPAFAGLFLELPESAFRIDLSSTELRARRASS